MSNSESPSYGADASIPETNAARGLRAALARHGKLKANAAPAAPAPAPATPATPAKPVMKWTASIGASAEARAVTQRAIDVMDSPHFAAHRDLAVSLFKNPRLSGAEICSILALTGATGAAEQETAMADMKAALSQARASVGGSNPTASPASASAAIWDKAIAAALGNGEASA